MGKISGSLRAYSFGIVSIFALSFISGCSPSESVEPTNIKAVENINEFTAETSVLGVGGTKGAPAIAVSRKDLPGYTVYHPVSLKSAPWPVIVWGNGACRNNGLQHAWFLRQVSSAGYLVLAVGEPKNIYNGVRPAANPNTPPTPTQDETSLSQLIEAMDWAEGISDSLDPLGQAIVVDNLAVMGHSCGGLQAIAASADPRVDTSLIFNSGVYDRKLAGPKRSSISVLKTDLEKIHAPIIYLDGGPEDIAHANNLDDFRRINHVEAFRGELPVGHGGTFWVDENGGAWADIAVEWLNWKLKNDTRASEFFLNGTGPINELGEWKTDYKPLVIKE